MAARDRRQGSTKIELLVVVLVLGSIIAMLLPAINASREAERRAKCLSCFKQLGLALQNYHDANKKFPASSGVTRDVQGRITAVDGWSWIVPLLPYMECLEIYESLDVKNGRPLVEPQGAAGTPHADALKAILAELHCASFRGSPYVDPATKAEAITNYKAMGATHHESLSVASPNPQTPKYDPTGKHPDGVLFPGRNMTLADMARDGTSHTVLIAETVEPRFARWTVGAEATMVGLPRDVEFIKYKGHGYEFYAPKGFDGKFGDESAVSRTYRTYLIWDCDKQPYDGADRTKGGKYGPSSHHPTIVNNLMGDGSVKTISKDVDAAAYMFVITRDGGDPAAPTVFSN